MPTACLGLGSNLGERESHLRSAVAALRGEGRVTGVRLSPLYETAPVGPVPQGPFLNAAAVVETDLSPRELAALLRRIEAAAGREPPPLRTRWGPRVLDLDLLLYDDLILDSDDLVIPHPRMHERWFVLRPLADVAPEAVHPRLRLTIRELLARLAPP